MMKYYTCALVLFFHLVGCAGAPAITSGVAGGPSDGRLPERVGPTLSRDTGTLNGTLDPCDPYDEEGRYFDSYSLPLVQGERVRLWVISADIDPQLVLRGPDEFTLESDDLVPGTLIPLIEFAAPVSGSYTLTVRAYQPGEEGAYTLGVLPVEPLNDADRLAQSQVFEGTTSAGGAGPGFRTGGSHWADAREGERLTFRLTSALFDTVAILFSPSGQVWINDDANDVGEDGMERTLDSTLTVSAPETGLYHLLVSAYGDTGGGSYRLRLSSRPPVLLDPGEQVPAEGYAGRDGNGRIWGLFVGISAYQSMGNLYGCGDDARFLSQAFQERNLVSREQQILLTDDAANRRNFLRAMETLLAKAGPEDVLVIFFSGHGNIVPASPGDPLEIDGTDESIVLVDGEILDNELAGLLAEANAGLVVVALDSCHSGGFARDLIVRPNIVGIFSSDEDILSDTAEPLGAGGYLSYYLRRGVLGEADTKPRDGSLSVGELTDFIYQGFMASYDNMNPPQSSDPSQRLVIQRGSVGWGDLIWLYPRELDGTLPELPDVPLQSPTAPSPERPIQPSTCGP